MKRSYSHIEESCTRPTFMHNQLKLNKIWNRQSRTVMLKRRETERWALWCKSMKSKKPGVTGKFGLGVQNEVGQRLMEFCQENTMVIVWPFATLWTITHQAPLSMEYSRQEYWSGLLFSFSGYLPNPEIEPTSPALQKDSLPLSQMGSPVYVCFCVCVCVCTHIYNIYICLFINHCGWWLQPWN